MPVDLSDYNTVAMRIAEFRHKHPEGSLRPVNLDEPFKVLDVGGKTFITYIAAAYRSPDDACPGIGVAWEPYPGRTPYTRDSELMNAETSAWGRAIVAALAADTVAGIATREEVQNRRAEQESESKPPSPSRISRPKAEAAEPRTVVSKLTQAELADFAKTATTTQRLNEVWKDAGANGWLQTEIPHPETGEKITFQNYLYERADALKSNGSNPGAPGRKTAAAK